MRKHMREHLVRFKSLFSTNDAIFNSDLEKSFRHDRIHDQSFSQVVRRCEYYLCQVNKNIYDDQVFYNRRKAIRPRIESAHSANLAVNDKGFFFLIEF